jgi:hypothetical protein
MLVLEKGRKGDMTYIGRTISKPQIAFMTCLDSYHVREAL